MGSGIKVKMAILILCLVVVGCMKQSPPEVNKSVIQNATLKYHRFHIDIYDPIDTTGYVKKVDNFTVMFDPSASMTEVYVPSYECVACHIDFQDQTFAQNHAVKYGGSEFEKKDAVVYASDCNRCHQDPAYSKFEFAKGVSKAFNQTIPDFELTGMIRTFGEPVYHSIHYGLDPKDNTKKLKYDRYEYGRGFDKIFQAKGASPLYGSLSEVSKDWFDDKGDIAVIVVSDGKDMDEREVQAAMDLKNRYGDRICIYTILIGNDPFGRSVMDRIAQSGKCGVALNGDQLLDKKRMEKFTRSVFLKRASKEYIAMDGDGIPDWCDLCPGTKEATDAGWDLVIQADVLFDFDKYNLKPEGIAALEQITQYLKQNPMLNLHISGHTDNFGSMAYNITLSKQRALSGYNYLVNKGIAPQRLSMSWHSYTILVATNETPEGRALNRRLEFEFLNQKN
jgi:OmpA-OmpF porin, OOP family